jgi:hypothetical protein
MLTTQTSLQFILIQEIEEMLIHFLLRQLDAPLSRLMPAKGSSARSWSEKRSTICVAGE